MTALPRITQTACRKVALRLLAEHPGDYTGACPLPLLLLSPSCPSLCRGATSPHRLCLPSLLRCSRSFIQWDTRGQGDREPS